MHALNKLTTKRKEQVDNDKMAALNAWHRVDCRTREALKRNFLSDLVLGYEVSDCITVNNLLNSILLLLLLLLQINITQGNGQDHTTLS